MKTENNPNTAPTPHAIKNMVCGRCIRAVAGVMKQLDIPVAHIELGRVETPMPLEETDLPALRQALEAEGFELLEDGRARLVERIKTELISLVQQDRLGELTTNLSTYLAEKLDKDYPALSALFSAVESITLERYFILQKVERAKELLVYGELTASEIAYRLGYSSGAHLANQFRQETGFSPTEYRRQKHHARQPLDSLGQ